MNPSAGPITPGGPKCCGRLTPIPFSPWAAYEGEALIGVVRLVGDGASILYVQDLLVRPEYQRRGIGSELLRRALAQFPQVYQTVLLTDDTEKTRAFYQAMGLTDAVEAGCRAFVRFQ